MANPGYQPLGTPLTPEQIAYEANLGTISRLTPQQIEMMMQGGSTPTGNLTYGSPTKVSFTPQDNLLIAAGGGGQYSPPLTYDQFLATRNNSQNPYSSTPQQSTPDYSQMISKLVNNDATKTGGVNAALPVVGAGQSIAGGGTAFSGGSTFAGTAVGSTADGGTLMSTGLTVPASEGAPIASTASTAAGAAPSMFSWSGIGSAGNGILPLAGLVGAGDVLANNYGPGRSGLEGAASGAAIGSYFGPWGAVIGGGVGGLAGLTKGLLKHKTTKEYEKDRWSALANNSDPAVANFANQYQQYLASPQAQIDAQGPNTFDAKKAAGTLKAEDVWGAPGILENIPGWLTKLTPDQRRQAAQEFINQNLINSSHGDMGLTDVGAANNIVNNILSGNSPAPQQNSSAQNPTPIPRGPTNTLPAIIGGGPLVLQNASNSSSNQPITIKRTKTLSPGIGLDGKPINYSRR